MNTMEKTAPTLVRNDAFLVRNITPKEEKGGRGREEEVLAEEHAAAAAEAAVKNGRLLNIQICSEGLSRTHILRRLGII